MIFVGGSWDGEDLPEQGPRVHLPSRTRENVFAVQNGPDLPGLRPYEIYVLTTVHNRNGHWQAYIEEDQLRRALELEARADKCVEQAQEFARESDRRDLDGAVNRVYGQWAMDNIEHSQYLYAIASAMYQPRPKEESPERGTILH